ncbi:MAG: biofilm PGA synthesis N-glycosyltransferase PgaC [Bacteroidia bacterium]|jgi:biofilm PGA synthesis N-glycosyltransferase PgaC
MELTATEYLIVLLGVFALIQVFYYLYYFAKIKPQNNSQTDTRQGVSVIICARNELKNIQRNLQEVLSQTHSNFEVIVVNDGSTDGTYDYLEDLAKEQSKLRVLHLDIDERFHRGKKFAQTIGIKAAKHDTLLLTDADCRPLSSDWISIMAAQYENAETELVLGLGVIERKNNFVNWVSQLENFHTMMMYIGLANRKNAYMGVGRNLSYQRSLFFKVKGFAKHQHILSGDDDLFVNETATKSNVAICLDSNAATESVASESFPKWIQQKLRHFSTGRAYKPGHKRILGLYSFSLLGFYASLIGVAVLASSVQNYALIAAVFGFRFLIQAAVIYRNMKALNFLQYFWLFPFMDLGILFIQLFIGSRGYFSKPQQWN